MKETIHDPENRHTIIFTRNLPTALLLKSRFEKQEKERDCDLSITARYGPGSVPDQFQQFREYDRKAVDGFEVHFRRS